MPLRALLRSVEDYATRRGWSEKHLDFELAVNAIIQVFTVLSGVALTDLFDDTKNKLPEEARIWVFCCAVFLLLRFIIGNATHFKSAYGAEAAGLARSFRLVPPFILALFLKDLTFLVAFGYEGVQIAHSRSFLHFFQSCGWFVGLGLLWPCLDLIVRSSWPYTFRMAELNRFCRLWIILDFVQLAGTGAIACEIGLNTEGAEALALSYLLFFLFDCYFLTVRPGAPPPRP